MTDVDNVTFEEMQDRVGPVEMRKTLYEAQILVLADFIMYDDERIPTIVVLADSMEDAAAKVLEEWDRRAALDLGRRADG